MPPNPQPPDDFAERLAAPTPTPGGGAAAARVGLIATSLLRMVTSITLSKSEAKPPDDPALLDEVRQVGDGATLLGERFRGLEAADARAFDSYLEALRLPKESTAERQRRDAARRRTALEATDVPLEMLEAAVETVDLARRLADVGSRMRLGAESDVGGAVELAHGAFRAAELTVQVNLPALGEEDRRRVEARHEALRERLRPAYEAFSGRPEE